MASGVKTRILEDITPLTPTPHTFLRDKRLHTSAYFMLYFIIGIKPFLSINICWIPRVMLKPEPEGEGFNDREGSSRCYCSRKQCLIVIIA